MRQRRRGVSNNALKKKMCMQQFVEGEERPFGNALKKKTRLTMRTRSTTQFQWSTPNNGRRKPAMMTWFEREDFDDIIGRVEEG